MKKFLTNMLTSIRDDIRSVRAAVATRAQLSPEVAEVKAQFEAARLLQNPADRLLALDDAQNRNLDLVSKRYLSYTPPNLMVGTFLGTLMLATAVAVVTVIAAAPIAVAVLGMVPAVATVVGVIGLTYAAGKEDVTIKGAWAQHEEMKAAVTTARGGDVLQMARSDNFDEVVRRFPALKQEFLFASAKMSVRAQPEPAKPAPKAQAPAQADI